MYKMEPLDKSIRNKLEHVVIEARKITETAARAALVQLGVGEVMPFVHLTEEERELRRKLRAHGRQLGDNRNTRGEQEIGRLIEEVAYEHWHRMLFARFLAENNLLMYPDPENPVAVTLEECEDLASDEGVQNGWELAACFATRMLPQIFRPDSPVFQLVLPPEHQQKLERLVTGLPLEVFTASDSLGWIYQYWQAKKKDEVNASEVKIGADELPTVTQLFTEPYMVSFLLDNSLGAWWTARHPDMKSPVKFGYMRTLEDGTPASGKFKDWPDTVRELKILDPCCGSGHFLLAVFQMLVPMRMQEEGLSAQDACDAVLRDNLHALELDGRCTQIAVFALALAAWTYPHTGGYRILPEIQIACSGLSVGKKREEWIRYAGNDSRLRKGMGQLYDIFQDAPILGSLIDPSRSVADIFTAGFSELKPLLQKTVEQNIEGHDFAAKELGVAAQGLAKAAELLSANYHLVITNVPFLGQRKQCGRLRGICEKHFPDSKGDLATVFLERSLHLNVEGGTTAIVIPEHWHFNTSYFNLRKKLLKKNSWNIVARLGAKAFQTPMWDFNVQLFIITNIVPNKRHQIRGLIFPDSSTIHEKAILLRECKLSSILQSNILDNPGARIVFSYTEAPSLTGEFVIAPQGIKSGDDARWIRFFWELKMPSSGWEFCQGTGTAGNLFSGYYRIIDWRSRGQGMVRPRLETPALNHQGICIAQTGKNYATYYLGVRFDSTVAPLVPKNSDNLPAIVAFCTSEDFQERVKEINPGLFATNSVLLSIPFDIEHWRKVAEEKYPNGLKEPYSEDPSQWIFKGVITPSDSPLQVAVARLLGYRWPSELDGTMELSDEARAWVKRSESILSLADKDGIVCIPPVRGEASGVDRLLNLLATAYDNAWCNDKLAQLLRQVGHAGKTLETWLRDKFFTQHCRLFHHRPFIWHIWDGMRDGFAALVNYHKLDTKLLESLIFTYLGDWISRQKQDKTNGVDGAEEKLVAAESLKKSLKLILNGEAPYDIFVRWKPIEKQPIGWDPDLNDGVRLNIRPFLSVSDVGKQGAGVLRDKPNINWNKDRGKDVKSAPWYHLGLQYGGREGDRINDLHLSLAEKLAARKDKKMEMR